MRSIADPPTGLGLLQLVTAPKEHARTLVDRLVAKSHAEHGDGEETDYVVELAEKLLIRRFSEFDREEIRKMFHLEELRKTRVWQEAYEEGAEENKRELIGKWLAKGMSYKQIADLLELPVKEVRRLAKSSADGE